MAALLFNSLSLLGEAYSATKTLINGETSKGLPLSKCHRTLTTADIGNRPVLIVGDIHGCFDELQDLVAIAKQEAAAEHMSEDINLICVGDMLNKGPKSLEVLNYLREREKQGLAFMVRGNHEQAILKQYTQACQDKDYAYPPRYKYLERFTPDDFTYISQLPYSISIPHLNCIIVHAGLVPGIPLHQQSLFNLCEIRNIDTTVSLLWGRTTTALRKPTHGVAWATTWKGPEHVYFGHDCRRRLQQHPLATGLDTGCCYGDSLTGVFLTCPHNGGVWKSKLLSSPARNQYYFGKYSEVKVE